jgi:hypothetical protein
MSSPLPRFPILGWVGLLVWMAGAWDLAQAQLPNTLRHSFFAPQTVPQKFEKQGISVAISGDTAVVGSPYFDFNEVTGLDCGAVKVYGVAAGQLLHLLKNPDATPFGYFGQAVAISGNRIVVGSGSPVGGVAYAGRVHVYDLASPTPTLPVLSLDNPDPQEFDLFGHSLALDGDRLVVGAWLDDEGAVNSGLAYVYDLGSATPQLPAVVLANPNAAEEDCFGVAVAVSGARVVVSAYHDDTAAVNAGRAYVYDLGSSLPAEPTMVLSRPGAGVNDGFGTSLAMSGDKVVIGIETADAAAPNSGSAVVFDLSSPTPTAPFATLVNPLPTAGAYFGTSVSISGDIVAVGAYRDASIAGNGGACHVYDLAGSTPGQATRSLRKVNPATGDLFGNAVSVSGSKILVAASHDDTGDNEAGASYLFDLASGAPGVPVSTFTSPVGTSADHFGAAVAISGDLLAIGAPESDAGSSGAGRVRIHDLASTKPSLAIATLENPDPAAGDGFGSAVAMSGTRVAVGAAGDDTGAVDAGSVYVYEVNSGTPGLLLTVIPNPAPSDSDGFGGSVSLSGNYVVVGAGGDNADAADAGRAYIFNLSSPTPQAPVAVLVNPSPAAADRFGAAVAISGNLVVIGAAGDDSGASDAGMVYVFDLGGVLVHSFQAPSPLAGDSFGSSVAVSGDRVAVGAPGSDTGAADAGGAFVFEVTAASPGAPVAILGNPAPATDDRFGGSIAISGARVVVGSMLDDGPADSGRVYSFNLASATPTVPSATLAKPVPVSGDQFGASIGVEGLIVVVGTPSDNKTATDKGAAYVFGPAAPEIAVRGPLGAELDHGGSVEFGAVAIGSGGGVSLVLNILNTGITGLVVSQVSVVGGNAGDFTVSTTGMLSPLSPGDDTSFTVTLNPSAPGARSTTLRIANSDANENPFDIQLTGQALSSDHDTDGDGLNDVSELRMTSLGFDWQVPDAALAATFNATANDAGLFSPDQVRALRIPPPTLSRDPGSGGMTLTLWLEKSAIPSGYEPFPLTPSGTSINQQGEMEFLFSVPDDTGFFRLETR